MVRKVFRRVAAASFAGALAVGIACFSAACAPDESELVARYDGGVITEQEVSAYTADFREQGGYAQDETWAQYLFDEGLDAAAWRQRVAGTMVEERLVQAEAEKQGIEPDEDRIARQEASDREAAGIAAEDDGSWRAYLAEQGTSVEEYRQNLEYASIEAQLYAANAALDVAEDDLVNDYLTSNGLGGRLVKRYRALAYDTREKALSALEALSGYSGAELAERFSAQLEVDDEDATTSANGGDIGWDVASDWGEMQEELNREMLNPGELSREVHELDGMFYVLLCTDRFVFDVDTAYEDLPDEELRSYFVQAAHYAAWNDLVDDYIAGLREAAHVQVRTATVPLPYDVDDRIAELKAQVEK